MIAIDWSISISSISTSKSMNSNMVRLSSMSSGNL